MVNCNIRHYFWWWTITLGTIFVSKIPLILEHLHGLLPTPSQWPHPQWLTLCRLLYFVFSTNNSYNFKNSYLNLKVTGVKSRCSACFWSLQVAFLALSLWFGGTGEAVPSETGQAPKACSTEVPSYVQLNFACIYQHLSATLHRHTLPHRQAPACSNSSLLHHHEQQWALILQTRF